MASRAAAAPGRTPSLTERGEYRISRSIRRSTTQHIGEHRSICRSVSHRFEWRSAVTGARNRLLGTWRRSRFGLSWPFTRRRGAGLTQRRRWPDGGRRQSGGRRRGYATACRAGFNSRLQESRVCPSGWGAQDVLQRLRLEQHLFIHQESRQLRRCRLGALLQSRGGYHECRITVLSAFALYEPLCL